MLGKDPDIFDDKGNVLHKLPKKKWDDAAKLVAACQGVVRAELGSVDPDLAITLTAQKNKKVNDPRETAAMMLNMALAFTDASKAESYCFFSFFSPFRPSTVRIAIKACSAMAPAFS